MQFTNEIYIDLPRDRVVELFDDTGNCTKWQPGLRKFEHLSGEPGQRGAKSRLVFQRGKREFEMIETITRNELPEVMEGTYETKGIVNKVEVRFVDLGPTRTKWISKNEVRLSGFMKIMAIVMPGCFKKETLRFMQAFKEFAEAEGPGGS